MDNLQEHISKIEQEVSFLHIVLALTYLCIVLMIASFIFYYIRENRKCCYKRYYFKKNGFQKINSKSNTGKQYRIYPKNSDDEAWTDDEDTESFLPMKKTKTMKEATSVYNSKKMDSTNSPAVVEHFSINETI